MTSTDRPLLAIVYGEGSVSAMKLRESAAPVCDLVWVVDSSEVTDPMLIRLLRKLGTTLDIAGMSEDEAAEALRPLRPDGIIAYADKQMPTASALAQRLALDYHDTAVTERLTDKVTQRAALHAGGLPVPRSVVVPPSPTPGDIESLAAGVGFPLVLKPRHGAASRDTVLVNDAAQLAKALAQAPAPATDAMVGRAPASGCPLSWCFSEGAGRVFSSSLGHFPHAWETPDYLKHLAGGLDWLLADGPPG